MNTVIVPQHQYSMSIAEPDNSMLRLVSAEVGAVDAYTWVLRFNKEITASDYTLGMTPVDCGNGMAIDSATRQANTKVVHLVCDTAAVYGDLLTLDYSGGDYAGGGMNLASFTGRGVTNNVAQITTLIEDAFTDTDGTAITAHTIAPTNPYAAVWESLFAPAPVIDGNALKTGAADTSSALVDVTIADVILTADLIYNGSESYFGWYCRAADVYNRWTIYYDSGTWYMTKNDDGNRTIVGNADQTLVNGHTYAIKIQCVGSTITFSVDDVAKITNASATFNQTATKVGFQMSQAMGTATRMDNFKVVRS